MVTLLHIVDSIVVLAIVVYAIRMVSKGISEHPGSLLVSIFAGVAVVIFGLVSTMAAAGLAEVSDGLTRTIFIAFLVAAPIVILNSGTSRAGE
jgi:hypothetical protein